MKTTILMMAILLTGVVNQLAAQTAVTGAAVTPVTTSKTTPIPKFLVYRHFFAWVNDLNSKALAAGASDPYKFAEPFQHANLQPADLDTILKEAKALDSDLRQQNEKLKAVVAEYRRLAQNAAGDGLPLPPAPAEIRELRTMRTAMLVQHMVSLQAALGSQKTEQLEAYLGREFVPHLSLKPLVRPAASTTSGIPKQSFGHGQQ